MGCLVFISEIIIPLLFYSIKDFNLDQFGFYLLHIHSLVTVKVYEFSARISFFQTYHSTA